MTEEPERRAAPDPYAPPAAAESPSRLQVVIDRVVAGFLVAGGLTAVYVQLRLLISLVGEWWVALRSSQVAIALANTGMIFFMSFVAVAAVLGGLRLWRHQRQGSWLAVVALAAQVPVIVLPGFQYKIWTLSLVGVGLNGSSELLRLGGFFLSGTQMSIEFEPQGVALLVNLPPALGLIALGIARRRRIREEGKPAEGRQDQPGVPRRGQVD
jgi:hypothetical protein